MEDSESHQRALAQRHETLRQRHFLGAVAVVRRCSRCSVINPSAVTACNALSGCDIFQHQSRNELASMPMANQGCRRGHTLAHLLMAFSIKLEPPRCKIVTLIGTCTSSERGADRQLMGFPTVSLNYDTKQNKLHTFKENYTARKCCSFQHSPWPLGI